VQDKLSYRIDNVTHVEKHTTRHRRIYINFISPWRQQTQNTQTYKAKQEKKKEKHTCNYKRKKRKSK